MTLADWMRWQNLDDEAVASKVGTDRTTISRLRRGITKPSWELAAKLKAVSRGFVTADEFLPTDDAVGT